MKKIIISFAILFFISTFSTSKAYSFTFPNVYIDAGITYLNAGDAESLAGPSWGLGVYIRDDFSLMYKGMMSLNDLFEVDAGTSVNGKDMVENYEIMMHLFGVEYCYHFGPIGVKGSFAVGFIEIDADVDFEYAAVDNNDHFESGGFSIVASIGAIYDFTQHIALFVDAAYQYSVIEAGFYRYSDKSSDMKDDEDISVQGIQVLLGARFTFGANRRLTDNY